VSAVIVDLFSGADGWGEGLRILDERHLERTIGVEMDVNAANTAHANGHRVLHMDVRNVRASFYSYRLEGLIASPPCPGFSSSGKGGGRRDLPLILEAIGRVLKVVHEPHGVRIEETLAGISDVEAAQEDDRSALVLEPLLWVVMHRPQWVALEQVPSVLPIWEAYLPVLEGLGYSVAYGHVRAEQYGVPQTRKRAILLASRVRQVTIPEPTHACWPRTKSDDYEGRPDAVSMADALGWGMTRRPYPTLTAGTSKGGQDPAMVGGSGAREAIQREADMGRWTFAGAGKTAVRTSGQRPREMNEPAHTITGKGTAAWVAQSGTRKWDREDPTSRRVTVEEAAALMTFPATYHWMGTQTQVFQQIGNAVPPKLAAALLKEVLS